MKIYVKEIIIIVIFATVLAFTYNSCTEKKFPLFPEPEKIVDDNILDATNPVSDLDESSVDDDFPVVSYQQIKARLDNPEFLIIDARSPEEYEKSHIGNAVNLFPHNDNESEFMEGVYTLPRNLTYLIYCTGGNCDLSHHLATTMQAAGFTRMFIYTGGWEDWTKQEGINE